jgi:hypothetical protein
VCPIAIHKPSPDLPDKSCSTFVSVVSVAGVVDDDVSEAKLISSLAVGWAGEGEREGDCVSPGVVAVAVPLVDEAGAVPVDAGVAQELGCPTSELDWPGMTFCLSAVKLER